MYILSSTFAPLFDKRPNMPRKWHMEYVCMASFLITFSVDLVLILKLSFSQKYYN